MQKPITNLGGLERTKKLRDNLLSKKPQMCHERAVIYTRVYKETEGEPMIIRRAKAFRALLEEMTIYILDGELIAVSYTHLTLPTN